MSLRTCKKIHSYQWEELSIGEYVIQRIESLAEGENQPVVHDGYSNFDWAAGVPIMENLDEEFGGIHPIVDIINNEDNMEEEMQEIEIENIIEEE